MTPTQAQIEAAAKAIFENISDIDGSEADWILLKQDCMDGAKAALTAAAEVEGDRAHNAEQNLLGAHYEIERLREWDRKRQIDIMELGNDIANLRAELEAEQNSRISAVNGMLAAEQREATTIERCAQVAENYELSDIDRDSPATVIAAAIRTLKDKT